MALDRGAAGLTMNINLTKKPMKPITMKPSAVLRQILLNSAQRETNTRGTGGTGQQQIHKQD